MENIINELSLNSQFNSSNEFIENSLPSFLEIFKVCNDDFCVSLARQFQLESVSNWN